MYVLFPYRMNNIRRDVLYTMHVQSLRATVEIFKYRIERFKKSNLLLYHKGHALSSINYNNL